MQPQANFCTDLQGLPPPDRGIASDVWARGRPPAARFHRKAPARERSAPEKDGGKWGFLIAAAILALMVFDASFPLPPIRREWIQPLVAILDFHVSGLPSLILQPIID
jgi:hypothetical protein